MPNTAEPLEEPADIVSADDAVEYACGRARAQLGSGAVTLESVAAKIGFSPAHLGRMLRDQGGFQQIRRDARMEFATPLLLHGNKVKEVARRVGLGLGHFAEDFKRHCGLRPTEVRRVGQVAALLRRYKTSGLPSHDVAAGCRQVDRWVDRHAEAKHFRARAVAGTKIARVLDEAIKCVPPPRPRQHPRRRAGQRKLEADFMSIAGVSGTGSREGVRR